MHDQPLVSVLLPFYNAERTLAAAVESILTQTYLHLELILINNNSTDASPAIAQKFVAADTRVRLLTKPQQGVVHATLCGYTASRGQFIARMDADDHAYPHKLAAQVAYLGQHPNIGAVSCLVENAACASIPGEGMDYYVQWTNTCVDPETIFVRRFIESPIINPTILFRRETIDAHGFYRSGDFPEDYELWLRLMHHGVQIAKVPETLLRWNDSAGRLTRTDDLYSADAFYRIKSRYAAQHLRRNVPASSRFLVWGAGRLSRRRAEMLIAEGIVISGYIDIKENRPSRVISYTQLAHTREIFVLVYVANRGAREKIVVYLTDLGFSEGKDFLCMA